MTDKLDDHIATAARADARALETQAQTTGPYPETTTIARPNRAEGRMFNLRLSAEQFNALRQLARDRHLPMATMARAWLLDRLDQERRAG